MGVRSNNVFYVLLVVQCMMFPIFDVEISFLWNPTHYGHILNKRERGRDSERVRTRALSGFCGLCITIRMHIAFGCAVYVSLVKARYDLAA